MSPVSILKKETILKNALIAVAVLLGTAGFAVAQLGDKKGCDCCAPVKSKAATPANGKAPTMKAGVQKITVIVNGGYSPSAITVTAGKPVELTFVRKSQSGCDGELLIPSLKLRKTLAPGSKTVVNLTPTKGQTVAFSCAMNMYRGRVVAK